MSQDKPAKQNNRRLSRRLPPKGKVKVFCRNGLDLGPNVGLALLDISETGARLLVNTELPKGQEITVTLDSPSHSKYLRLLATVMWCVPAEEDKFLVGIQFAKRFPYRDLAALGGM
jgi:hypothetical protein